METSPQSPEVEKPKLLYHASPDVNITLFEPRAEQVRDTTEGAVVFAGSDEVVASCFVTRTDDSWSSNGYINGIPYKIIGDEERYKKLDIGGAIYVLPSDSFSTNANLGMGTKEWTSTKPVAPIDKKLYKSGLSAMLQHGVQVFFTDQAALLRFRELVDSDSPALIDFINSLESENKKQGFDVRRF